MGYDIVIVGDEDLCTGFGLAGVVQSRVTSDSREAEKIVSSLCDSEKVGLVIIHDRLASGFSQKMKNRMEKITRPVLVAVPGKQGPDSQTESIAALIKKAIGVDFKVQ